MLIYLLENKLPGCGDGFEVAEQGVFCDKRNAC